MENKMLEVQGRKFKIEKSVYDQYPYRVTDVLTGEIKDSSTSHVDAAETLIFNHNRYLAILDKNSKEIDYVRSLFKPLTGKKKSECDSYVEENIAGRVKGCINAFPSERTQDYKEYRTENFIVRCLFENSICMGVTKVEVNPIISRSNAIK